MVGFRHRSGLTILMIVSLLFLTVVPAQAKSEASGAIAGFSDDKLQWQRQFEQRFSKGVREERIASDSRAMSLRPTLVGSEGNRASLKYAVKRLKEAGLKPKIKTYDVYLSNPEKISITQTAPEKRKLKVIEDLPPGTPFAEEVVPGYNAYSPAGEVEAELVYANYGRPEDFAELKKRGVSVKGKIVLVRYGQNFRGVKTDQAAKHGAKGVIIYSDPADDGFTRGKVYPDGPWRPADAIQRGSILYIYRYPGDPLTPGNPSLPGEKRISPEKADSLPTIPTTPISYGQARFLLENMEGPKAPESWQGGFSFPYRLGPGPTKVKISLDIKYTKERVNDIVVRIPGSKYPEETVVIGAHRDGWVYGARDNNSGWSSVMEIARVLGSLYQKGWRPERSIVLAGWDGEEYGLIGSTEWVEENRRDLTKNAVAYLNMDGVAGQYFGASAVPSMKDLIYSVTREVTEPRTGTSIYEDWKERSGGKLPTIGQLGSGSDYTAFLQHAGVPSADTGFSSGEGLYHSAYDNSETIERFIDPGYAHHAASARVNGIMALRLANADVLPFRYSDYAEEVVQLLKELEEQGTLGVDLSTLIGQAEQWKNAAVRLEEQAFGMLSDGVTPKERRQLQKINSALLKQERDLTRPEGLPGRNWYKHQIWAPGLSTGYAAQPLPALAEAIENGDRKALLRAVHQLQKSLSEATRTAKRAVEQ